MEKKKIERINELARKKTAVGLTEAETAEQAEPFQNIHAASSIRQFLLL